MRPLFSKTPLFRKLKEIVKKRVNYPDFEKKWQMVTEEFSSWELPQPARNTSDLNVRLEFLQSLCAAFPDFNLYRDAEIVNLLLSNSGARNLGETFMCKTPFQWTEEVKVVRRELTGHFGILYTLETRDGFRFTQEYFD